MNQMAALGENDQLDLVVDAVIEAAGGDARAAILDLVRRHHALEELIERSVSAGYVRKRLSNRRQPVRD